MVAAQVMAIIAVAVGYVKDMFFTLLEATDSTVIIIASMTLAGSVAYLLRPVIQVVTSGSDRARSRYNRSDSSSEE